MKYTTEQLLHINKHTGMRFCVVKDGITTNLQTGEIIPTEHISYQRIWPDGQYGLGEMTCDNAMPTGFNEDTLESNPRIENPTEADKDKYQCRIGRRAPLCTMYSPTKCAVHSINEIGKYKEHIHFDQLIALSGV